MIKDENYYVVQGWMIKQLGLKGTKRDIYAIIYGFTQNDEDEFTGSLSYLQEWCNTSKVTIIKCLQELVDEGLIEKTEEYKNNVKFCRYKATLPVVKIFNHPSKEILPPPSKETLHNNIDKINNNIKRFVAPTLEEVKEYARSKNRIDLAEPFYNYYTADEKTMWCDKSGKKIKSWKQKFMTWVSHDTGKANFSTQRQYTREEMNSLFQNIDEIEI